MNKIVDLFPAPGPIASDFDLFWAAYPKKQKIGPAKRRWAWALLQATPEQLIEGAKRYAAYCKAQGTEDMYIQTPANWLMDERWLDEYGTAQNRPDPIQSRLAELRAQANAIAASGRPMMSVTDHKAREMVRLGYLTDEQARKAGYAT